MKQLRPHQMRAIEALRASIANGARRPVLQLPTGAGKTILAAELIRRSLKKGHRVAFLVDALSLVDQTLKAFHQQGLTECGVIQGQHWATNYGKPVQICTVQTLQRRHRPEAKLVIVDECHCQSKVVRDWAADEPNTLFVGLTATPGSKGLGKTFDHLIPATSIGAGLRDLITEGYLCDYRVYAASHPDLSGVKITGGDYKEGDLSDVMAQGTLVGDTVRSWLKLGEARPTFAFCVDRAHAAKIQKAFQAQSVGCGYIDAYTDADERAAIKAQLDRREISVVANVGCLTKGVDWEIGCISLCRPTRSVDLYTQIIGRGLRVNPSAGDDCIVIDHSDNTARHGFVDDIIYEELDGGEKKTSPTPTKKAPLPKPCGKCSFMKPAKIHECPKCGFVPEKQSGVETVDADLIEVTAPRAATKDEKQRWYSGLLYIQRDRKFAYGWVGHKYKSKFGVWPRGLNDTPMKPGQDIRNFARAAARAYSKTRNPADRPTYPDQAPHYMEAAE